MQFLQHKAKVNSYKFTKIVCLPSYNYMKACVDNYTRLEQSLLIMIIWKQDIKIQHSGHQIFYFLLERKTSASSIAFKVIRLLSKLLILKIPTLKTTHFIQIFNEVAIIDTIKAYFVKLKIFSKQ